MTSPTTPQQLPPRPSWRSRLGRRGLAVGAAVLALLVVAAIAVAFLVGGPDRDRDRVGPAGFGGPAQLDDERRGDDRRGDDRPGDGRPGDGWGGGGRGGRGDGGPGASFGDGPVLTGTVVSVADGALVVAADGGAQRTLRTDDATRVRGGDDGALGDLQAGERVAVAVEGTGDTAVARTVWSPDASVTGTVTAVTGDRATVLSVEGLPVTADVAALSQRPVAGDVVVLTGTAADQVLRAERIRILPAAS
jgi:hypothetical protein